MITSKYLTIRQLSSRKIAKRLLIGGISFIIIINIFVSVGYTINKNVGCGPLSESVYSVFYIIYNIILSLGPLCILSMFSVHTLFHVQ